MKAALSLLALAAPAADTAIGPPPYRLIAPSGESYVGNSTVGPGSVIASAILGRPDSALLTAPLKLDKLGQKRAWVKGDALDAMTVTGVPGFAGDSYCEHEHEGSVGKILAGQMLFGLVGLLRPTKVNTRFCLFDKDLDGSLDHAFLIGAKGSHRAPFAIAPTPFALISGVPFGGDSKVILRYAGPSGAGGALRFDLELHGFGRMRRIATDGLEIARTDLPKRIEAGNAIFTVMRFDPGDYSAQIQVERAMAPGRLMIADASNGD